MHDLMGDQRERLQELFENVEYAGTVDHPLSMPYQHFEVFVCRKPKFGTLQQVWPELRHRD